MTATWDETGYDVVTGTYPCDTCPDLLDDPGPLVTPTDRQSGGQVADVVVDVAMAKPRCRHPDQHLVIFGRVDLDLAYLPSTR
jgi:hypothetical protein